MKKGFILLILQILATTMWSQTRIEQFGYHRHSYYKNQLFLSLSARRIHQTNTTAPRAFAHDISAWTGDFSLYKPKVQLGKNRYVYRNKLLGELFLLFNDEGVADVYRDESTALSHFLVGEHAWAWNFLLLDRLSMAAGVNMTDFSLGATYVPTDSATDEPNYNARYTPEPNGWYIGLGPTIFTDFLITDFLLLETQFDYTFNVFRIIPLSYGQEIKGYPMPQCGFLSVNLMTPMGLHTGIDYSFLIDRGATDYKPRKFEFQIGYRIKL